MGLFFGTDGLRGKVNDDLSFEICYRCGNALGVGGNKLKILIGRDTRGSGEFVALAFSLGAMNAGACVTDVGVCPTAGVSYLTKKLGFDYGVVISASHNPAEFNGIKIFDKNGKKLGDKREEEIERRFLKNVVVSGIQIGRYSFNPRLTLLYQQFLKESINIKLENMTIVLDLANGACFKIAPAVFRACGAKVVSINGKPNGDNINLNAGSLHITNLQKYVKRYKADMGFAFDGDSDRVVAIDEEGNVVDGDKILYLFAKFYKENQKLNPAIVVGTRHTNMGVENALKKLDIELLRADIGDKYVSAKLDENKLTIGGEQSGHIILKDKLVTGDGVLNALVIASICKKQNKNLSSYFNFEMYHQCNINVPVCDKMRIINSAKLTECESQENMKLNGSGRIMIRVSGTEPYIRIMVETKDENKSKKIANNIKQVIEEIDKEF